VKFEDTRGKKLKIIKKHVNFENFEGYDGNSRINPSIPKSSRI